MLGLEKETPMSALVAPPTTCSSPRPTKMMCPEFLDGNYTLTHMTGTRQSRTEWLEQVNNGEMTYHQSQEHEVEVEITRDTTVVVGRKGATIWGSRGT